MNKPKEKRMIGINWAHGPDDKHKQGSIGFECRYPNIVEELKEFGSVMCWSEKSPRGFLDVSPTYDYDEVLEYIKYLGTQKPEKKEPTHRGQMESWSKEYACHDCAFMTRCMHHYGGQTKMHTGPLFRYNPCPFYKKRSTD